ESLAIFQQTSCVLKRRELLVVVTLRRRDRRMTEEVAHLRQRHTTLGQTRGVFMPQVVPAQIRQFRPRQSPLPSRSEEAHRLSGLVAEYRRCIRLLLTFPVESLEFENGLQTRCSDWDHPRFLALGGLPTQHEHLPNGVDIGEPQSQHLA